MWKPEPNIYADNRRGFTLIELMIVVAIVAFLASALGVTIVNMGASAREAQTVATINKINGLINERQRGLERAYEGNDFRRELSFQKRRLEQLGLFGISPSAIETVARKDFFRKFFPQRFAEMADNDSDGIPDRIAFDEVYGEKVDPVNPPVRWAPAAANIQRYPVGHDPATESSEILYFALTRMDALGFPLVGADEFLTQEVADSDGDGLPEFVDGWGNPLRFYRWPTRLIKPFGLLGHDQGSGRASFDDDGIAGTDDLFEIGTPGTDDVVIDPTVRFLAGNYALGLPRPPGVTGQYDMLNEDPDDPYGLLLAEVKRLAARGIDATLRISETHYHTIDTFHKPLVVSAGPDGLLGLFEPQEIYEDVNGNGTLDTGEDVNRSGSLDTPTADIDGDGTVEQVQGHLAMPRGIPSPLGNSELPDFGAADDITNLNRRAGG
jgi:prepilin-type N-terminal cleavage/methylation domain-containing protein